MRNPHRRTTLPTSLEHCAANISLHSDDLFTDDLNSNSSAMAVYSLVKDDDVDVGASVNDNVIQTTTLSGGFVAAANRLLLNSSDSVTHAMKSDVLFGYDVTQTPLHNIVTSTVEPSGDVPDL